MLLQCVGACFCMDYGVSFRLFCVSCMLGDMACGTFTPGGVYVQSAGGPTTTL